MAIGAQAMEQLLGTDTSVREFHIYQSLAKFTPADIANWLHNEGGIVGQDAAVHAVASVLYAEAADGLCGPPDRLRGPGTHLHRAGLPVRDGEAIA